MIQNSDQTAEIYARLQDAAKELASIARELAAAEPEESSTAAIQMVCCGLAGLFLAPHRLAEDLPVFVAASLKASAAHLAEADGPTN